MDGHVAKPVRAAAVKAAILVQVGPALAARSPPGRPDRLLARSLRGNGSILTHAVASGPKVQGRDA